MNNEQIFELAEKNSFQDDSGCWIFKDEGLLDFVFMVQKAERERAALRQALAQPVDAVNMSQECVDETAKGEHKREWVGLTRREFEECVDGLEDLEDCWVAIETKLKEKNT